MRSPKQSRTKSKTSITSQTLVSCALVIGQLSWGWAIAPQAFARDQVKSVSASSRLPAPSVQVQARPQPQASGSTEFHSFESFFGAIPLPKSQAQAWEEKLDREASGWREWRIRLEDRGRYQVLEMQLPSATNSSATRSSATRSSATRSSAKLAPNSSTKPSASRSVLHARFLLKEFSWGEDQRVSFRVNGHRVSFHPDAHIDEVWLKLKEDLQPLSGSSAAARKKLNWSDAWMAESQALIWFGLGVAAVVGGIGAYGYSAYYNSACPLLRQQLQQCRDPNYMGTNLRRAVNTVHKFRQTNLSCGEDRDALVTCLEQRARDGDEQVLGARQLLNSGDGTGFGSPAAGSNSTR